MLVKFSIVNNAIVKSEEGEIWLFTNPNDIEKKYLIEEVKINEHTLNSALDPDELARLEFGTSHIAAVIKTPKAINDPDSFNFKVCSIGVFIFNDKLIYISKDEIDLFSGRFFDNVYSLESLFLKSIYKFVDKYFDVLKIINNVADEIELKIEKSIANKYLLNLFMLDKSLVYFLNASTSNDLLLAKIKENEKYFNFSNEDIELLEDIIIENKQLYKQTEIYSSVLASLAGANASIVSNNLGYLMKTLNIVTIGIMLPSLIVAIFSMNVPYPIKPDEYTFWYIIVGSLIATMLISLFWRFKKL